MVLNELVNFYGNLESEEEEIISELESSHRKYDLEEDIDFLVVKDTCKNFIMDLLINMLQVHYDSHWIVSNLDNLSLSRRLGKQKEREKQTLLHRLDGMTDEQRMAAKEQQKMGITNWFKTSGE